MLVIIMHRSFPAVKITSAPHVHCKLVRDSSGILHSVLGQQRHRSNQRVPQDEVTATMPSYCDKCDILLYLVSFYYHQSIRLLLLLLLDGASLLFFSLIFILAAGCTFPNIPQVSTKVRFQTDHIYRTYMQLVQLDKRCFILCLVYFTFTDTCSCAVHNYNETSYRFQSQPSYALLSTQVEPDLSS